MAEDWEAVPAVAESPEIKLFGKWSTDDVQINDISLQVCFHGHYFLWELLFICQSALTYEISQKYFFPKYVYTNYNLYMCMYQ